MRAKPKRIQLRRTKGWRMPPNTVKVDRTTKWGSPYRIDGKEAEARETSIRLFREYAVAVAEGEDWWLKPLRGKNLACWCKPGELCHADVLLELANR